MAGSEANCRENSALDSPSATDVGNCDDSLEMLHEDEAGDGECWLYGNVETTVAVEQAGVAPIQNNVLRVTG